MKYIYQIEHLVHEIGSQIFDERFEPVTYCGKVFSIKYLGLADCKCCSYYALEVNGKSAISFAPWQIGDTYDLKKIIQEVTK